MQPIPLWPKEQLAEETMSGPQTSTLSPYLVPGAKAAMIVCPGGGYNHLAQHEGEPIARWLNSCGITAFVLKYRVSPHRHPAPIEDARRAIRTVRHYSSVWGYQPDRIGILGFSAGGHLAAAAGTLFCRGRLKQRGSNDIMILCYPVISFTEYARQGCIQHLLGERTDVETLEYLSLEKQVTEQNAADFYFVLRQMIRRFPFRMAC